MNDLEKDLLNLRWLMFYYCKLSSDGRKRAKAIFKTFEQDNQLNQTAEMVGDQPLTENQFDAFFDRGVD